MSRIPIVALIANAMVGDREKYLISGMNDHVSKPFDPDELLATVRRWTDGFAGDVEPKPIEEPLEANNSEGTAALDPSIVDPLRTAKPELWKRLVDLYLNSTPDNLKKLEHAIAEVDRPTARMMAHSMKSSSANMGAMRLSDLCRWMEAAAAEEKLESSAALLTEICREFDNVTLALARDSELVPSAESPQA